MKVHFSSRSDEWETPAPLFNALHAEFSFTLDAACRKETAKCSAYYTKEDDALGLAWSGVVWLNPPYSRGLQSQFIRKARESARAGATVVCLIPARPDTALWQDVILPFAEVRFLRGRVRFVGASAGAPFPSAVAIFRPVVCANCADSAWTIPGR